MIQFDLYRNAQYPLTGYKPDWHIAGGAFTAQTTVFDINPGFNHAYWRVVWMPTAHNPQPFWKFWKESEHRQESGIRLMWSEPGDPDRKTLVTTISSKESPIQEGFNITDQLKAIPAPFHLVCEVRGNPRVYLLSIEVR